MLFKDVVLAIEGCNQFAEYQQHVIRRSTFIIASSGFNGKNVIKSMSKTWPVEGQDGPVNISERNKKILAQFKELDVKQKAKQLSNAGRSKDSS